MGTGGKKGKMRVGKRNEGGWSTFSIVLTLGNVVIISHAAAAAAWLLSHVERDPMDDSLPGSFVCGISQARILEWVAISSFMGSS